MTGPDITPEMRVGELLRAYPHLEETLIGLSPEFQRLKNPVLRATVARLATLRQVAQVGGIGVGEIVRALRTAAGQAGTDAGGQPPAHEGPASITPCGDHAAGVSAHGGAATGQAPAWFDPALVVRTLDVRPLIEAGEHPLAIVVQAAEGLHDGEILELITPFEPAPLIDVVRRRGFTAWVEHNADGTVRTRFIREA